MNSSTKKNITLFISLQFIILAGIMSFIVIPAYANSSTPTVIGGATNGNIFGSVQLDELNFTSSVTVRTNGEDGPILYTAGYDSVNPTWVWNSTVGQEGITLANNKDFRGVPAAGGASVTMFKINAGGQFQFTTANGITGYVAGAAINFNGQEATSIGHVTYNANNSFLIGSDAGNRPAAVYTVLIKSKSQVTGDINFEGGDLDWTLIETRVLGDDYDGLVLIDKPTIIDGEWVFPENYRRIFEVNEEGVFYLGNKLVEESRVDGLEQRIEELEKLVLELIKE